METGVVSALPHAAVVVMRIWTEIVKLIIGFDPQESHMQDLLSCGEAHEAPRFYLNIEVRLLWIPVLFYYRQST